MTHRLAAGIDIGGTNTHVGLVDEDGKILCHDMVKTTDFPEANDLVNAASEKIFLLLANCKLQTADCRLAGAGIGAPNGNYFNGTIEFAPNLAWKGIIPLAKMFTEKLNVPAVLTNDANAAALGEMYFGGAKGMKDFIFITLGTGLGSGIVSGGKLIYGHDGFAGEIGHVIVVKNGRQCGCGRKGCLEQYASASGIVLTYLKMKESVSRGQSAGGGQQLVSAKKEVDAKKIYELALTGDQIAIDAFSYTGEILGLALANSVAYTAPEAIFLFGGLAQAGDLILTPTKKSMEENLLHIWKGKIKLLLSSLPESDAAVLGAASLIWNEMKAG